MRIGLVACGKKKQPHMNIAKWLYTGDLFKKASAYCERHYDKWYILSAKHGLLHPFKLTEPYDQTLVGENKAGKESWAQMVYEQLQELGLENEEFFIHAGKDYQFICKYLPKCTVSTPEGGIGRKLQWYKNQLSIV
jgi:hypothetical protein